MGKSYKKTPILKSNNQKMKKISNKRIRKIKDIPSGKYFRKTTSYYDICNYRSYKSYKMFEINKNKPKKSYFKDITEDDWNRWYKRK